MLSQSLHFLCEKIIVLCFNVTLSSNFPTSVADAPSPNQDLHSQNRSVDFLTIPKKIYGKAANRTLLLEYSDDNSGMPQIGRYYLNIPLTEHRRLPNLYGKAAGLFSPCMKRYSTYHFKPVLVSCPCPVKLDRSYSIFCTTVYILARSISYSLRSWKMLSYSTLMWKGDN
jgi:hypothetical protein